MEWIAGDIGGTKSRLAWLGRDAAGRQQVRFEQVYASAAFATAVDLIRQFIADAGQPRAPRRLLLAVPGPLRDQRVALTNLNWTLDASGMRAELGMADVRLINDFQAAAAGVATLTEADLVALNPRPVEAGGVRVITGAGTGLGLAFMLAGADGRERCHPTEGGHADFAPANAEQGRLLEHLRTQYGHVSWERAVSGTAMNDLYRFCCIEQQRPLPEGVVDGADLVARAGTADPAAEAALDLFVELYGAWVGNVALLFQPGGGLYVAGGIAVHLEARMRSPRFMAAAADKGRMRGVVERTPIFLITSSRLGVQGAMASAPDWLTDFNSNTAAIRSGT